MLEVRRKLLAMKSKPASSEAGGMREILRAVEKLKESEIGRLVESRMEEFRKLGTLPSSEIFKELCFCILTANFSAEKGIRIQEAIGDGFLTMDEESLARMLRELGHRYPEARARYIVEARRYKDRLARILRSFASVKSLREWLVKNVRGIGYKEASHFLRNVGYTDVAILDFHILDLLARHGVIERPRSLTRRRYLEIEEKLRVIAEKAGLTLGELDLYLWYLETGKVLK